MTKTQLRTGIAVAAAIIVMVFFLFFNSIPVLTGGQGATPVPATTSSVVIQDIKAGTGLQAVPGANITVTYVGKLQNGTIFDQSARGSTFKFTLGAGRVIPGWEQGIQGMKVGGERILIIPPSLAYGSQAVGPIPANSTLIFDVKLVDVSTSTPAAQ